MTPLTRRRLIQGAVAASVAAVPKLGQAQKSIPPVKAAMSGALLGQMRYAAVSAARAQFSPEELRPLAMVLETWFKHLDEIGAIEPMERFIVEGELPVQSWEQFNGWRSLAAHNGVEMDDATFRMFYDQQANRLSQIQDFVRAFGLRKFHAGLIEDLRMEAGETHTVFVPAGWYSCFGAAIGGLYLATWQVMGLGGLIPALTAVLASPVGVAAVTVAGAALAVYGAYCAFA